MPKKKTAKSRATKSRFIDPLIAAPDRSRGRAPAGTQKRAAFKNPSEPILDSRRRGNERRKVAPDAPWMSADDDPMPADPEAFQWAFLRKILTLACAWRRCRAPICRRSKRCAGADFRCRRDIPRPQRTPEQQARIMAALKRTLERRLAEEPARGARMEHGGMRERP